MNKDENIYVTKSYLPPLEEYIYEIKDIWDTHILTNMGPKHSELEIQLSKYLKCNNVALYTNGHLALENAIASFNFPKGSEVITTPFSFASTTHAIVRNSLKPVFCDINNDDYTIDANKIESLITEKTVAILPVHVYGNICDVDLIANIANKYNLKVIYDSAHAFGEEYKNQGVATFGDISMFSFHATKVFNTIEGGAICFSDYNKKTIINDLKNFGIHDSETVTYVGGNAKMNEFQAAMGLCNLRHLEEQIAKRKTVVERYISNLTNVDGIILNKYKNDVKYNYSYFPIILNNYKYSRNELFDLLAKNGIIPRKYFYPLINDYDCYKNEFSSLDTPIAKIVSDNVLTLPLYPELSMDDVDRICQIIKS